MVSILDLLTRVGRACLALPHDAHELDLSFVGT